MHSFQWPETVGFLFFGEDGDIWVRLEGTLYVVIKPHRNTLPLKFCPIDRGVFTPVFVRNAQCAKTYTVRIATNKCGVESRAGYHTDPNAD